MNVDDGRRGIILCVSDDGSYLADGRMIDANGDDVLLGFVVGSL